MRLPRPRVLLLGLGTCALAAAAFSAGARQTPEYEPSNTVDPKTCSTVTGPFKDASGTYFKAENRCNTSLHCRVWVNGHEPPTQIHLDTRTNGRIDLGPTDPGDKFSNDCIYPGVAG